MTLEKPPACQGFDPDPDQLGLCKVTRPELSQGSCCAEAGPSQWPRGWVVRGRECPCSICAGPSLPASSTPHTNPAAEGSGLSGHGSTAADPETGFTPRGSLGRRPGEEVRKWGQEGNSQSGASRGPRALGQTGSWADPAPGLHRKWRSLQQPLSGTARPLRLLLQTETGRCGPAGALAPGAEAVNTATQLPAVGVQATTAVCWPRGSLTSERCPFNQTGRWQV